MVDDTNTDGNQLHVDDSDHRHPEHDDERHHGDGHDGRHEHPEIVIDDKEYRAPDEEMTGNQLRNLAEPHIGEDRDLWLEVPHGHDELIADTKVVRLRDHMRFFSTPKHINPGRGPAGAA